MSVGLSTFSPFRLSVFPSFRLSVFPPFRLSILPSFYVVPRPVRQLVGYSPASQPPKLSQMNISLELTVEQQKQLEEAAKRLNLRPEQLAAAAVRDLVGMPDAQFSQIADRVLTKNAELYDRLR